MKWASRWTEISSSPATSVVFRCAGRAMNMREEKEPSFALSAKPDTNVSKVRNLQISFCKTIYIYIYCVHGFGSFMD